MRYFQNSKGILPNRILNVVSQDSFAKLYSSTENNFVLLLNYKLSLNNANQNILDFDRIEIKIKRKDAGNIQNSKDETRLDEVSQVRINPIKNKDITSIPKLVSAIPNTLSQNYPKKVTDKLYSGIRSVNDFSAKEDVINQQVVSISSLISDALSSVYSYVQLEIPQYTINTTQNKKIAGDELLESNRISQFYNKNFFSLSQYVDLNKYKVYANDLGLPEKLIYDYLNEKIDKKPLDEKIVVYKPIRKTGVLQNLSIPVYVSIPLENKGLNLEAICSLYKTGKSVPEETIVNELYTSSYFEEYDSIFEQPQVKVTSDSEKSRHYLSIVIDSSEAKKLTGYNIYRKAIKKSGLVDDFQLLSFIDANNGSATYSFSSSYPLEIVRVIPVYKNSKEAHLFQDVIVGKSYPTLGEIVITVYDDENSNVIEVYNLPKETKFVELYKRNCLDINSQFKLVDYIPVNVVINNVSFSDKKLNSMDKSEYFVVARLREESNIAEDRILVSNYVIHVGSKYEGDHKKVSVGISEISNNSNVRLDPSFSFNISTTVLPSESKKIVEGIQSQINELYNKYINPQNSDDVAKTGTQNQFLGMPEKYSELLFHEVVRTNLTTGDREVFELVGEGLFEDKNATRNKKGISPLNPENDYLYQVFTYTRNPIELFKNFVAHGVNTGPDGNKREWFYLPYKWLNPKVKDGLLYSSDEEGIPIIPENENLKLKTYGLTAAYNLMGKKDRLYVDQVIANRLSLTTVKITWEINVPSLSTSPYDSFMVMAVVNGRKKYIGITRNNFMLHRLDRLEQDPLEWNDYGIIYYIVIPISSQLSIDPAAYSNELVIDPEGLHGVIKLQNTVLENETKKRIKIER